MDTPHQPNTLQFLQQPPPQQQKTQDATQMMTAQVTNGATPQLTLESASLAAEQAMTAPP